MEPLDIQKIKLQAEYDVNKEYIEDYQRDIAKMIERNELIEKLLESKMEVLDLTVLTSKLLGFQNFTSETN